MRRQDRGMHFKLIKTFSQPVVMKLFEDKDALIKCSYIEHKHMMEIHTCMEQAYIGRLQGCMTIGEKLESRKQENVYLTLNAWYRIQTTYVRH